MITSKFIINVFEKYFDSKNVAGRLVTIFENPDKSEFKELEQAARKSGGDNILRFIADGKNQKMYVWDAYNARHADVRQVLRLPPDFENSPGVLDGYLDVSTIPVKMFAWEDIQYYIIMYKNKKSKKLNSYFSNLFTYNWSWLDRYADCSKFISNQQKEFEKKVAGKI